MAAAGYTWYWDNDGVWTPYSQELQDIIEAARSRGDSRAHLPIGNNFYIIDFHESVQESPVGNRRRISRRITGSTGNNRVAQASENTLWFWRDDDGITWKPYDTALSQRLTQARLEGDIEVYLEIRETLYQVDMARNLQINMISGYGREIRQKQLFQKVVFLGHNNNNRSTTNIVQQMIHGGNNNNGANANTTLGNYDTAAPDVNINVWHPAPHPELSLQIWEFIGRHALYPYQSIFFTPQTLFVIVWEIDGDDEQQQSKQALDNEISDKVQFWINLVEERVPDSAVIMPVVCTQDNDSNGGNMTETEVRRRCQRLRRKLTSQHSKIQFCDDVENPVAHVRLPPSPSPIIEGMDVLQRIILGSVIANATPLANIDVTLQTAIRSKKENGMKIADADSLGSDLPAVSLLSNSGECMVFPTLPAPFTNWVVLDVPWFYRLGGCILLHNWLALIDDGRRRDGRSEPPSFAGAMPENCPNLYKEDARMLWQNSLDASNYSAQEQSELTATNNTILDFLPALLIHFGVLVPIDVNAVDVGDNGGGNSIIQHDNTLLTTTVPFYMPSLGIIHPSTTFVDANLFCVPSLLEGGVQGDNTLAEYRNASGSANTFVAQKVEFESDVPDSLMGTIIANLLRNILSATNGASTGHVLSVKTAYCWRSMFRIKFSLSFGDHRQTILEVCSQLVESAEGGKGVKSYLFTNANEIRGEGGRHIWEAGYGLVCDTIHDVMSSYQDLAYTREAFCHECLVADGLRGAPSWGWSELENALKGEQESLRCPNGHLALESLSDQQELSLKRAVVLIGLYDASKKSRKIIRLGSGVVVDAIRGLIITAARNVMKIEGNERFGQNYDGIVGGKIVVGVIPETGGEAVFRYFAKIRAKDPALSSSNMCHVDACVLKISSRFENDVRGNGDRCNDEIEMLVRGTVRGLVQLPTQSQWEVEDPVRIFGYDQGDKGVSFVGRRLSHVGGQICQYREPEANRVPYTFQPLRKVVVRTPTNHGYVGGPCINKDGKVIGILSCADPDEPSRSCVVPAAEWQPLLQTVP